MTIKHDVYEVLEQYSTVIIHRHTRPDPDALGAQYGLYHVLTETFPENTVCTVGNVPDGLTWMGSPTGADPETYTDALAIVLDTAEKDRIDGDHVFNAETVISIDHHPDSEDFADLQWVDTEASSTAEMITVLTQETALTVNDAAAKQLYTGIVGDTGRFRHDNVTPATHRAAATLLQHSFSTQDIFDAMGSRTLADARFDGFVLSNLEQSRGGTVYTYITQEDMQHFDVSEEEASNALYAFSNLDDVPAWVLFLEQEDGDIRVRLRSKHPVANTVAEMYGGGGHDKASGATLDTPEEIPDLVADFDAAIQEYQER